jgi:hypothetical protein
VYYQIMPVEQPLSLELLLPPAPLPALIALLLCTAIFLLGRWGTCSLLRTTSPNSLHLAAGFVVAVALLSAFVHGMALAGISSVQNLRVLGLAIAVVSILSGPRRQISSLFSATPTTWSTLYQAGLLKRVTLVASGLTAIALTLASLAPPTDIDTLAYHLSLPMDWLANGGAHETPYWLHSRLVGVGESINMLGIAVGTDCLGTLLQACGLLVAIAAVTSTTKTSGDALFGFMLIVACPLWSYLTLTTKPQLLPAAASTVALALLWQYANAGSRLTSWPHLLLMLLCVMYAAACKYSFLPSSAILCILIAWQACRCDGVKSVPRVLTAAGFAFSILVLPVWLRNLWFYGDPLSPVLENLRGTPDPALVSFSSYLRDFSGEHSFQNMVRLPVKLVIPTNLGRFSMTMGAGALAWIVALDRNPLRQIVLISAASVALISVCVGQLSARFLVEPYLWCALAAASSAWTIRKRCLTALLGCQLALSLVVAVFAAGTLLPGALSPANRKAVLRKHASDYLAAEWLNQCLPVDAVVASDRRPLLYHERKTIPNDFILQTLRSNLAEREKENRITSHLKKMGVTTLVITEPAALSPLGWLTEKAGNPLIVSEPIEDAVRNPWRKGQTYRLSIFDLRNHPLFTTQRD